jgi:hypothetical protein
MFGWLTSLLTGGVLSSITSALTSAWSTYESAQTNEARISALEHVQTLQAIRDVQIAEASNKINTWMRAIAAAPFIVYVWKLVIWDKIIMAGTSSTDNLSNNLWYLAAIVYGFLFLHWTAEKLFGK